MCVLSFLFYLEHPHDSTEDHNSSSVSGSTSTKYSQCKNVPKSSESTLNRATLPESSLSIPEFHGTSVIVPLNSMSASAPGTSPVIVELHKPTISTIPNIRVRPTPIPTACIAGKTDSKIYIVKS